MSAWRQVARAARIASLALALCTGPAVLAQANPALPAEVEGVGITQKLDSQVPLGLKFRDESGRTVELGSFFREGRPVLLTLAYYECPMLCTLVLNGQTEALRELAWTPGEEFEVVTVSIAPDETPALAAEKKKTYLTSLRRPGAEEGWHFLTGDRDQIAALADAVGFAFRRVDETGEYAHPAALFVLTPEGRVSRYLFGVAHDAQTLRLSLVEAADGRIGSAVDKFLLYCYRYDSEEGRYTPVAWNLMRLGGGLFVLVLAAVLVSFWRIEMRRREKRLA